jgi:hypothetical protein
MNNVRREASRYLRNKKREYLKDEINELATNSKNKNIRYLYRGINEFKRGYQPRNNLVKDEKGDLLADSHNILNRWVDNVRMDLREVGWGDVDWIGLAQDRNRWRVIVNSVLNLRVP